MLRVINDAFVQHDKAVRDIVSRGKCPDNASDLFISGETTRKFYKFNRSAQRIFTVKTIT